MAESIFELAYVGKLLKIRWHKHLNCSRFYVLIMTQRFFFSFTIPSFSSVLFLIYFGIFQRQYWMKQKGFFSLILNSVKKKVCFYPMCLSKMRIFVFVLGFFYGKSTVPLSHIERNPLLQLKTFLHRWFLLQQGRKYTYAHAGICACTSVSNSCFKHCIKLVSLLKVESRLLRSLDRWRTTLAEKLCYLYNFFPMEILGP